MSGQINHVNQTVTSAPEWKKGQPAGRSFTSSELSFERLLSEQLQKSTKKELQFSRHAAERVEQRGIQMTPGLMGDLSQAVEKARSKGAKDVVVIGSQGAFIVNIPNNTVVTTMSPNELKDNIFTNIDSAVIM